MYHFIENSQELLPIHGNEISSNFLFGNHSQQVSRRMSEEKPMERIGESSYIFKSSNLLKIDLNRRSTQQYHPYMSDKMDGISDFNQLKNSARYY
jgi:hypothetical protein